MRIVTAVEGQCPKALQASKILTGIVARRTAVLRSGPGQEGHWGLRQSYFRSGVQVREESRQAAKQLGSLHTHFLLESLCYSKMQI